jgi:hypothetical protein
VRRARSFRATKQSPLSTATKLFPTPATAVNTIGDCFASASAPARNDTLSCHRHNHGRLVRRGSLHPCRREKVVSFISALRGSRVPTGSLGLQKHTIRPHPQPTMNNTAVPLLLAPYSRRYIPNPAPISQEISQICPLDNLPLRQYNGGNWEQIHDRPGGAMDERDNPSPKTPPGARSVPSPGLREYLFPRKKVSQVKKQYRPPRE